MANTLTGLIQVIQDAIDIVSRELVGMIPAVSINAKADQVALDQTIRVPIVPAAGANVTITPGVTAPDSGDVVMDYVDMTIDKSKMQPVRWNGEEQLSLQSGGSYSNIARDRFVQAMRALVNEIEGDLWTVGYQNSSRGYGTAGSTPFSTSVADSAQLQKILDDNGAPASDRSLVIDTTAAANLRSLQNLVAVYAAGTDRTLRQGTLLPLHNFDIKQSGQIGLHTKGAGTGYDIVVAGEAVGQVILTLENGTVNTTGIKAGDIVTFAGGAADANKYCVKTGLVATDGNITIGNPGLIIVKADADEMTIGNSYTPNLGFHRQAIQLLARAPQMPIEGDQADDVMVFTDPLTGIPFQVAMYKQYRQVHYEVGIAWGKAVVKSEHIATLIG